MNRRVEDMTIAELERALAARIREAKSIEQLRRKRDEIAGRIERIDEILALFARIDALGSAPLGIDSDAARPARLPAQAPVRQPPPKPIKAEEFHKAILETLAGRTLTLKEIQKGVIARFDNNVELTIRVAPALNQLIEEGGVVHVGHGLYEKARS